VPVPQRIRVGKRQRHLYYSSCRTGYQIIICSGNVLLFTHRRRAFRRVNEKGKSHMVQMMFIVVIALFRINNTILLVLNTHTNSTINRNINYYMKSNCLFPRMNFVILTVDLIIIIYHDQKDIDITSTCDRS